LTDHKAGVTHINQEAMRMRDSGVFNKDMTPIVQSKKTAPVCGRGGCKIRRRRAQK
jgi:hypothetical protein